MRGSSPPRHELASRHAERTTSRSCETCTHSAAVVPATQQSVARLTNRAFVETKRSPFFFSFAYHLFLRRHALTHLLLSRLTRPPHRVGARCRSHSPLCKEQSGWSKLTDEPPKTSDPNKQSHGCYCSVLKATSTLLRKLKMAC